MAFLRRHAGDLFVSAILLLSTGSARAAQALVHLKDGSKVKGEIVEESDAAVTLRVKFGTITYKRSEIRSIEKEDAAGGGAGSAGAAEWRDVVMLKSGGKHVGLLVSEDDKEIVFDVVMSGKSVSRTLLARTTIPRSEIKSVRKLTDQQRAGAREYLRSVKQEVRRDVAAAQSIEVESKELTAEEIRAFGMAFKRQDHTKSVKQVKLEHFVIVADLEEDFLRKVASRLAKVFGAYKTHFGVDRNEAKKVRVFIFNSCNEYRAATGQPFVHPAFYRPDLKVICAGFALAEYKAAITKLTGLLNSSEKAMDEAKARVRSSIDEFKRRLRRSGGTTAQAEAMRRQIMRHVRREERQWQMQMKYHRGAIDDIRSRIRNVFDKHTKNMIRTSYHEGVHAFVDQFLFDEKLAKHVPRWLNEGLAQYFENARVERARLILGQENREWLSLLRRFKREGKLVPIEKLLAAGPDGFHAKSSADKETVAVHYRQSWYLTHMLGEKGRLKKEYLVAFVRALADKRPPMDALPRLTGMPNAELEKEWEAAKFGSRIGLGE